MSRKNAIIVPPKNISIHVHDGKIKKNLNDLSLASQGDRFPVQMEAIWVENTERSLPLRVADFRENLLRKYSIAVSLIYRDVCRASRYLS
jgi:hypothetical protein